MSTPTVLAVDGKSLPSITPTVLAVDGNSLLHRAFHASARTMYRTPDGAQGWAVRGLLSQLVAHLLGVPSLLVDMKKAALVCVALDHFGPAPRGVLRWMLVPKLATPN